MNEGECRGCKESWPFVEHDHDLFRTRFVGTPSGAETLDEVTSNLRANLSRRRQRKYHQRPDRYIVDCTQRYGDGVENAS